MTVCNSLGYILHNIFVFGTVKKKKKDNWLLSVLLNKYFVSDSSKESELTALLLFASCFHTLQGPTNRTSFGFCCHIREELSSSIKQLLKLWNMQCESDTVVQILQCSKREI